MNQEGSSIIICNVNDINETSYILSSNKYPKHSNFNHINYINDNKYSSSIVFKKIKKNPQIIFIARPIVSQLEYLYAKHLTWRFPFSVLLLLLYPVLRGLELILIQ